MREHWRLLSMDDYQVNCDLPTPDDGINDRHQHSMARISDMHLASRKAEESALRRSEAASWLEQMVGPLDLASQPSEEQLRLCLRNGLVLCNLINKINPGAVQKVVQNPAPSVPSDGPALSAYQYFENVRNFVVAVEEMQLTSFEASDLEKIDLPDGSLGKVVGCILALKSYYEWKQNGGQGFCRSSGTLKLLCATKPIAESSCESLQPRIKAVGGFPESLSDWPKLDAVPSWRQLLSQKLQENIQTEKKNTVECSALDMQGERSQITNIPSESVLSLVMSFLRDKSPEEIPFIEKNRDDLKRKFDDPYHIMGLQGWQARIDAKPGHMDERRHLVEIQKDELKGLRNAFTTLRQEAVNMQTHWGQEIKTLDAHMLGLAHAAAGYHKVLAENRDLYNQVQDLKGKIRVYCRIRPSLPGQDCRQSLINFIKESESLMIVSPLKQRKERHRIFKFNKVFGPCTTQEDVFLDTQPLIRSVLDGFNVCIFAYGQTGSGKTYTMSGPNNASTEYWGVNIRALHDLFAISQSRGGFIKYDVGVQMIEIYNEQVKDLLCTHAGDKKLDIRNSSQQNGLNVPDAIMVTVRSSLDVMKLMDIGHKNRSIGATALNERSSRSHSVLTVHVNGTDLTSGTMLRGRLHLVDLAGSERVSKSEAVGDRLKEAQHINKSLSALGDVIAALANKSTHVPYRNSKLTQLLHDSLGGQAKTLMFVHVSPDEGSYGETMSTLKFAERVATVELGAARSNRESGEIRELKEQISWLKDALVKKDADIKRLLKENHGGSLEILPDKVRLKTSVLPLQSHRMNADTHSQWSYGQSLEDMHSAEIWQGHFPRAVGPKVVLTSDISFEDPFDSSQFQSSSKYCVEEDPCDQRVTKTLNNSYSAESSSTSEAFNGMNSSLNKGKHEMLKDKGVHWKLPGGNNLKVQNVFHQEKALGSVDSLQAFRCLKPPEGLDASKVSFTSPWSNQIFHESSLQLMHEVPDSVDDCSTEDSSAVRAVGDDESSDLSELDALEVRRAYASPFTNQELNNKNAAQVAGKPQPGYARRTHKSGAFIRSDNNKMPASSNLPHLRSLSSSIGSGVESFDPKRPGGISTVEAKFAICSEAAVEYYSKAKVPRQSSTNSVSVSSELSRRWL